MIELIIQRTVRARDRQFDLAIDLSSTSRHIALAGPSGAGKSLTARCVAGLLAPDNGRIVVGDRIYFDASRRINLAPQQRKVGYLAQDYQLFPHLTVRQNILFGLTQGWRNSRRRRPLPDGVHRWAQDFGLAPLLDSYPTELSGGQQQRVALVRALAIGPDLLILDEPLAALDRTLRSKLRRELASLQRDLNMRTILISHDPDDLAWLATDVFFIDQGRVTGRQPSSGDQAPLPSTTDDALKIA